MAIKVSKEHLLGYLDAKANDVKDKIIKTLQTDIISHIKDAPHLRTLGEVENFMIQIRSLIFDYRQVITEREMVHQLEDKGKIEVETCA